MPAAPLSVMGDVEMPAGGAKPAHDLIKTEVELHGERVEASTANYAKICVAREAPAEVDDPRDSVAFTQVEFLVSEADPSIDLAIARRGPATEALTVKWITENMNCAPGSYKEQSGTATFQPGEKKITITLEVLDNPQWSTESFQIVKILDELPASAILGELYKTTMVILNDDPFPQGVEDTTDQVGAAAARSPLGGAGRQEGRGGGKLLLSAGVV